MTSASEWSGPVGGVWAAEWRRTDRSFADLSRHLDAAILAAAPGSGTVLDIGCGAGGTSLALAVVRPDLDVIGLDVAPDLLAVARDRAADLPNARFVDADLDRGISDMSSPGLVMSRHGVMFFADPAGVFAKLAGAAAPGAHLVFSCFRDRLLNPWAADLIADVTGQTPSAADGYSPGPFGFADRDFTAAMLAQAGWRDVTAEPIDFRYVAGEGDDPVADAVSFFRRIGPIAAALRAAPDDARPAMLDKLAAALQKRHDGTQVAFPAAAWIWRARAAGERV